MHDAEENVFVWGRVNQFESQKWADYKIERKPSLLHSYPVDLSLAVIAWYPGQITERYFYHGIRCHDLNGMTVFEFESGTQNLVPLDQPPDTQLERAGDKIPAQPQAKRDVVSWISRMELVKKPQALLRQG